MNLSEFTAANILKEWPNSMSLYVPNNIPGGDTYCTGGAACRFVIQRLREDTGASCGMFLYGTKPEDYQFPGADTIASVLSAIYWEETGKRPTMIQSDMLYSHADGITLRNDAGDMSGARKALNDAIKLLKSWIKEAKK